MRQPCPRLGTVLKNVFTRFKTRPEAVSNSTTTPRRKPGVTFYDGCIFGLAWGRASLLGGQVPAYRRTRTPELTGSEAVQRLARLRATLVGFVRRQGSPVPEPMPRKQLWPHLWGHDAKRRMAGVQERLLQTPFRKPERLFGKRRRESKRVKLMLEVAASFLTLKQSTCEAKTEESAMQIMAFCKQ